MKALNQLSAAAAARSMRAGELTSEQYVSACLARIEERERNVQAWAHLDSDYALSQARARDTEAPRSPLHGIPIGIKDVIDTADMPTAYNSPIYTGHRPKADAACVALLRRAGCVILGKTVTTEFATNHPSHTRNPNKLTHTPGGSSSGSAAAVRDGMVPLALGTQTGGSTIRPAAYCGTVAYKPSFGSINRAGLKFVAESLDTIGLFSRTVEDVALLAEALTGRLHGHTAGGAPRIGLCRTPRWTDAESPAQDALESAASRLAAAGAVVTEMALPAVGRNLFEDHGIVMHYECARALAWEQDHHSDLLSTTLRPRLSEGWSFTREQYEAVLNLAEQTRQAFTAQMNDFDFLLTPSAPGEAPARLDTTGSSVFNRYWTLLGTPCVTLPFTSGPQGLPLGVQLVGSYGTDSRLLAWAAWVEQQLNR